MKQVLLTADMKNSIMHLYIMNFSHVITGTWKTMIVLLPHYVLFQTFLKDNPDGSYIFLLMCKWILYIPLFR